MQISIEFHAFNLTYPLPAGYFKEFFGYPIKNINTAEMAVSAEQI